MQLYQIDTGFFKLDGGAMFGVVPKTIWEKLNPADGRNLCTWAMRCLLIEDGKQLILIDTGIGNKQAESFFRHYEPHGEDSLTKSLQRQGFSPDDVTDVILTHLHFDHCGGAVVRQDDKLIPFFKQARYWSSEAHWDWAVNPNPREKASFLQENILPLKESGQLHFVHSPLDVHPSIQLINVSGHTESMFIPRIEYKNHIIYYGADLIPSAAHIPIPYVMAYDTRPLLTLDEKKQLLTRMESEQALLFFEHDPRIAVATLKKTEKGIAFHEEVSLF